MCGWTLARAHARSGDRDRDRRLPRERRRASTARSRDFAERYADQNERDYAAFAAAVGAEAVAAAG